MAKNFIRSLLVFGLLIFLPKFTLRSQDNLAQSVDFESYLRPQDRMLLDQEDPMVYLPTDFIELMENLSSDMQELNDLIDHVKMGYIVAPLKEVAVAVQQAIKSCDIKSNSYTILRNYQGALLNGDALIRTEKIGNRSRRSVNFCTLFVQQCASIGNLSVRCNLNTIGTISASNFIFTGATNCSAVSTFPNISSCGNIIFNSSGPVLNAQGAFETLLALVRATISLGVPSITLVPTTINPGASVTVGVLTSGSAFVVNGLGLSVGAITGNGFSSGVLAVTPTPGSLGYHFIVDLHVPLSFNTAYAAVPTITQSIQTTNAAVGVETPFANENTSTIVTTSVSNVTTAGAVLDVLFNVTAQGSSYTDAANNTAVAINNIISNPVNALFVNLIIDGPVN